MKRFLILAIYLFPLLSLAQQRPNIIVFLVDDMGWMDTSVPFSGKVEALNQRYHTPNMVRLAREGMKFTNAYATPICTPTRVSLITGLNAAHHRVTNWTNIRRDAPTDHPDSTFLPLAWNYNGLSPKPGVPHTVTAIPLPRLLQEAGYYTIHVGKAHFGSAGTPGANPYNLGFQVNIAGNAAGHPQSFLGTENYGNLPGKISWHAVQDLSEYYGTETFLTEAITLEALKALDGAVKTKKPFFLHLSHFALHDPLQADPRFIQRYQDAGLDPQEAKYASMVEGMDKSLGEVLAYLQKNKLDQNTLLLFVSDNGGLSMGAPRGGKPQTHNLPLRAGKGSVYEGGIRVPLLVRWPGTVKAGTTAHQYLIIEDFFPTLLEVAGVKKVPASQGVDGKSFLPLLKNPALKDTNRVLVWHHPNNWLPQGGPGINYKSAARQGDWKLVYDLRTGQKELYHLRSDLGETTDLAHRHPEKVAALSKALGQQLRHWNALLPIFKNTNTPVPMPDQAWPQ
ncbi:sulfatase [Rufibacter glacialis]|uniref:Sulfatase n=1 Tax=Rufibacter glacialis TaxID=1259555 RepID=A0A5M8QC27_9BACT|nr:sulfatase [Rufibacter glacialis]KAA6432450.1 sulfatase [Rufibacter glacialis]GGK78751.1 sulfatase [Rufibacter glacialis]